MSEHKFNTEAEDREQRIADLKRSISMTENHDSDNPNPPTDEHDCFCVRCCAIRLLVSGLPEASTVPGEEKTELLEIKEEPSDSVNSPTQNALLPCPFCGSEAYAGPHPYYADHFIVNCGSKTGLCIFPSSGPVLKAELESTKIRWNQRAESVSPANATSGRALEDIARAVLIEIWADDILRAVSDNPDEFADKHVGRILTAIQKAKSGGHAIEGELDDINQMGIDELRDRLRRSRQMRINLVDIITDLKTKSKSGGHTGVEEKDLGGKEA